jgi:pimeloyl-ACP methyl ester carboxylesterase
MFLLIHGGGHTSKCWEPTLPYLDAPFFAIDLPGRGSRPAPLDQVHIADCVNAAVEDLKALDGADVVVVGHSMAGLTIPGLLEQAHELIKHVVFVSCAIPPDGESLMALLPADIREMAESFKDATVELRQTDEQVRLTQTYDMNEEQAQFTVDIVVPESPGLNENVDLIGLKQPTPRTWVKLLLDRSFTPDVQEVMAARAGCTDIVELDSGHMAMISHPAELAAILNRVHSAAVG